MCETCGCNITEENKHLVEEKGKLARTVSGRETVAVLKSVLAENDHQAAHTREHFDRAGVLAINLMSSPGAGKTALLEATIDAFGADPRIAVVVGDLDTENDAQRLRECGVEAVQITTGTACHLDAHMVHRAVHRLNLEPVDILFIENVGNLVCPASFELGQHRNVTLLSVPEGDDKPAKYPVIFRAADLVVLSKADLLPVIPEFDAAVAETHIRELASAVPVMVLSGKTGAGLNQWVTWLRRELNAQRARRAKGETGRPGVPRSGTALHLGDAG